MTEGIPASFIINRLETLSITVANFTLSRVVIVLPDSLSTLSTHGFTRLVGKYFNNTESHHESNEALMLEHGFVEIYDCGQASYTWTNKTG